MIPSFSLLFPAAWSLPRWSVAPGGPERSRSSRATAYSICPRPFYKADKWLFVSPSVFYFVIDERRTYPHISVTVGVAIAAAALILSPGIPGTMKPILNSGYYVLSSTMACRVYRALLLRALTDSQLNTTTIGSFYRAADTSRLSGRSSTINLAV